MDVNIVLRILFLICLSLSDARYNTGTADYLFGIASCDSYITYLETDSTSNLFVSGYTYCKKIRPITYVDGPSSACNKTLDGCSNVPIAFVFRERRGIRNWQLFIDSKNASEPLNKNMYEQFVTV